MSLGDPAYRMTNVAGPSREQWRAELSAIGGRSPLLHFVDEPRTRIELSSTHPGGLARFITGKTTLLSSLIRDDVALRAANRAADAITSKGVELATARGIDSVHLGIGIAEWAFDDESFCAPVLLRPLAIRRFGRDFEVRLRGSAVLNPELAHALAAQFGIALDAGAFAALAESDGTFKPNPVIDRLRGLTSHLEWFNVQPRLVVSSFADVAPALVRDASTLDHPVLDALAGNANARWRVQEGYAPVEPQHQDQRSPETDTLLLDADAEQENVVAQIAAGNSVVVKTLPGTGGTQTIINAIGCLVAQNKRVLVIGPRRSSLTGLAARLADVNLSGVAVAPGTLRRDLVRSIARNEKAQQPSVSEVDEALIRLRKVLLDYRGALSHVHPQVGVSVLDCLRELSGLAMTPDPATTVRPSTTVRLGRSAIEAIARDRSTAANAMVQAATLGEFRFGPDDSPWYGAEFASSTEAGSLHVLARRLHEVDLPRLLVRGSELIGSTHMRPFENVAELGVYLRLLADIRDSLDKFLPVVFDRSLSEIVAATAPRRESPDMSAANRRRLKRLAKEYLRPGVHVSDLHGHLARIQEQRLLWQRLVVSGAPPEIPVGIADAQVAWQNVDQDLSSLQRVLRPAAPGEQLSSLPLPELGERLAALAADSDVLGNLQERAELRQVLRALDLDALMADLAARHVPASQVSAELELAWWQSTFEMLLDSERALLGANTGVLDRLEADFRLVDEAHATTSAQLLAWQLAENWKIGLLDWPDEAVALKTALRRPSVSSGQLQDAAPHLSRALAPVWLASPYEVSTITDQMPFDTVILVDSGAMTIAESIGGIRRAKHVVAFGDPVTQTPGPFTIAVDAEDRRGGEGGHPDPDGEHARSALSTLSGLLPVLSLTRSYRAGGEDLAELVNRRFYAGRIQSLPWAGSFLGHPSIRLDYVSEGSGLPDAATGSVESVDAEVARVVELVLEHAATRPRESLMVITASPKHAVRVQQEVLSALAGRADLSPFLLGDRPEPFTVMTIEEAGAESRDRVIFSIGFGRTPHGRMLSDFGALGHRGGERLLAVAMTRARRSMVIVTCFEASDIDDSRMTHGAVALAEILTDISGRDSIPSHVGSTDPMLIDLARRLESRGIRVALGHRGKLGLVCSRGGICLAIETDSTLLGLSTDDGQADARTQGSTSLRESLRLRPEMLRRLGWHYLRVHAFDLFNDPDAVADKVATILGATVSPTTEPITVV